MTQEENVANALKLSQKDIEFVKTFGTVVKSGTERYVLELKSLNEPVHFINPKDAGTKYGDQNLKGDSQDILLLNGLSAEQIKTMDGYLSALQASKGKTPETMDVSDVQELLTFLEQNNYNDRYCSNQAYKNSALIPTTGHMYRRNNDECHAVVVPKGTTYSDMDKTQQANVEGALFIVDSKGGARITNVPEDYQTVKPNAKIISYREAVALKTNAMLRVGHTC